MAMTVLLAVSASQATAGYPDVSAVTVVINILLNLNRQTGLQDEFDSAQDRFD